MRFFLYICTIISLAACNRTPSNLFTLEGTIEGAEDSEIIVLCYFSPKGGELHEILDTTRIINGKFLFEGNIDELTAAELCFDTNVSISVRLYLEPKTMKLQINKNQLYAYQLSGTKVEKENTELKKELEADAKIYYEGLDRMNNLLKQINSQDTDISVLDSLINLFQQVKENVVTINYKMNRTRLDFILRHNTYQIAPDLLYLLAKQESFPMDTLNSIYNNLPEQSKTGFMGKLALKQINYSELESDNDNSENALAIGSLAPDFTRKDLLGKTIRLSDFKNKNFVLLDFWASWCAPCKKEIPKIKDLYGKYSEKGLAIISISIDEDTIRWINAINKYQLDAWHQILAVEDKDKPVSNSADDISLMYNVDAIPHFILLDKQGKIIVNGAGGERLMEIDSILNL